MVIQFLKDFFVFLLGYMYMLVKLKVGSEDDTKIFLLINSI